MSGFALERIPAEMDPTGVLQRNMDTILAALGVAAQVPTFVGNGDPNGQVPASPPARYFNLDGGAGTTLYVKESGTDTTTGWVGK